MKLTNEIGFRVAALLLIPAVTAGTRKRSIPENLERFPQPVALAVPGPVTITVTYISGTVTGMRRDG
jgi:hypothetical protein